MAPTAVEGNPGRHGPRENGRRAWRAGLAIAAVAGAIALPGAVGPPVARAADAMVSIQSSTALTPCPDPSAAFCYAPAQLTIPPGASIEFQNLSLAPHTVASCTQTACGQTSPAQFYMSLPSLGTTSTFSPALTAPGVYPYYCTFHTYMRGTITVLPGAPPPTPTPTSGGGGTGGNGGSVGGTALAPASPSTGSGAPPDSGLAASPGPLALVPSGPGFTPSPTPSPTAAPEASPTPSPSPTPFTDTGALTAASPEPAPVAPIASSGGPSRTLIAALIAALVVLGAAATALGIRWRRRRLARPPATL